MKTNNFFFLFIMATMPMTSIAQTITNRFDFGYADRKAFSIPKEFTLDDVPYLTMYGNDNNTIQIYNENLDIVKQISMKEEIPFNYQLTYLDETRKITAVNEVEKSIYHKWTSYEEFIQQEQLFNSNFDESCLIITEQSDGTRKISIDYSKLKDGLYHDNSHMYFAYDYFGFKYPKMYFIDSTDSFVEYNVRYNIEYSDWESAGTRTVDCSASQKRIKLCNINLNNGDGRTDCYFEVSQTLFNKDASFEYIMPIYKWATKGNVSYSNPLIEYENPENIITTRSTIISEQKEIALAGFQLVSEDDNVISNITFDGGFEGSIDLEHAFVITIGNSTYLAFNGYRNHESSTIFYKIDNSTNSIQKVKTVPSSMSVSPTIVNKGAIVNVNFTDRNEQGSDIIMTSASGAVSQKLHIPAGQSSAQIHTDAQNGMYCISRFLKGKLQETKKVVVK